MFPKAFVRAYTKLTTAYACIGEVINISKCLCCLCEETRYTISIELGVRIILLDIGNLFVCSFQSCPLFAWWQTDNVSPDTLRANTLTEITTVHIYIYIWSHK